MVVVARGREGAGHAAHHHLLAGEDVASGHVLFMFNRFRRDVGQRGSAAEALEVSTRTIGKCRRTETDRLTGSGPDRLARGSYGLDCERGKACVVVYNGGSLHTCNVGEQTKHCPPSEKRNHNWWRTAARPCKTSSGSPTPFQNKAAIEDGGNTASFALYTSLHRRGVHCTNATYREYLQHLPRAACGCNAATATARRVGAA